MWEISSKAELDVIGLKTHFQKKYCIIYCIKYVKKIKNIEHNS